MLASTRREEIISLLESANEPISANQFGRLFNVSRQVIVGDIALLRAANFEIIATNQGYILNTGEASSSSSKYRGKIVCMHTLERTQEELSIIVNRGGIVLDVQIDHPLYGIFSANLQISTIEDIHTFLDKISEYDVELLSSLTNGIHIHTIETQDKAHFDRIYQALDKVGIIYN